ncbi:protein FAM234A [Discoglossus pictus]
MDTKDLETEVHPLKNSDLKPQENYEPAAQKDVDDKKQSRLSRLSHWRTAAFFVSLFLCLTAVFAFSFIIPCPVRPISERTWSVHYDNAVIEVFLSTEDVNQDKVKDVLFLVKAENGSIANVSCADEGFQSPCFFLTALSGTNGNTLWTRPVAENVQLAECGISQLGGSKFSGCFIVGKTGSMTAIDSQTGETLWQSDVGFPADSAVTRPLLKIPDVDGDEVQDLMAFATVKDELQSVILSGKSGNLIGKNWRIGNTARHFLHVTWYKALYVLLYTGDSIEGYSVSGLYTTITGNENKPAALNQDPDWEQRANHSAGYVPISTATSPGDILYLMNVPGRKYNHLLVVKSEVSELLDGQTFKSIWSMNTTNILSKPEVGYYKKDFPSIVMELGLGNNRKKVVIIDGSSGSVEWELEVSSGHSPPNPATLHTMDHRSFFLFWGEHTTEFNSTVEPKQYLYMFHPSHPSVLLQLNNHTENIVLFNAVLFERSRHACYVLLMGPKAMEAPGTVGVFKRKLKEGIHNSTVIWLGKEDGDDQEIREQFFRMRYITQS